jgi:serine/threonine protein kinase/putative intracellular protease/amidase
LHEYALGKGEPDVRAFVEDHLAGCSSCAALLLEAPDDTLIGKLRDTGGTVGLVGDTVIPSGDIPAELIDHPKYRILRQLGAGGMGVVYQAVHKLMEREVALKVISAGLMRHPVAVERFRKEMKAVARLNHPNIVAAHDAEQVGDLHFLVMEYVDGASLDRLVRKSGPMALSVACYMVRQALMGLQHAHDTGLVHRDLKPQNIMVTRKGQVKVLDFGLARLAEEAARPSGARPLTSVGTVVGTPDYIAPEQVSNSHTVDIRADIYSLGCTLYFLLTGRPPFPEGSALEKALSHVQETPAPLRSLRPEVSAALGDIVDRMMAKAPADRFQTPGEAAQALLPFTKSGTATTVSIPSPPPASNPSLPTIPASTVEARRTRTLPASPPPRRAAKPRPPLPWGWIIGGIIGVVLLGALVGLFIAWLGRKPPPPPEPETESVQPAPHKPHILLVLPARRFSLPDFQGLTSALEGHAEITVATSGELGSPPKMLTPASGGVGVLPSLALKDAQAEKYEAVIFSGGAELMGFGAWRENTDPRPFVQAMLKERKPVAGLGTGVVFLFKGEALDWKRFADHKHFSRFNPFHKGPKDGREKRPPGAEKPVEEHGDVIIGRDSDSAGKLVEKLLARLRRSER